VTDMLREITRAFQSRDAGPAIAGQYLEEKDSALEMSQSEVAQPIPQTKEKPKDRGFFAPEKKGIQKGVVGGLAMMAIAVVWFVVGYAAGYVFYYPPILFLIGLYAFIKGLITGNIRGKKEEEEKDSPQIFR
ncbi:MAG: hypothetical protein JSV88_14525, partial [Candidatus Aminicenantes bacterium]